MLGLHIVYMPTCDNGLGCICQQRVSALTTPHAAVSFCRHIHGTPACLPAGVVVVVGVEEGSLWPKVRVWARARTRPQPRQTLPQPRRHRRRRRRAPEQAAPTRGRRWLTCPPRSPCQLAADAAAAAGAAAVAVVTAVIACACVAGCVAPAAPALAALVLAVPPSDAHRQALAAAGPCGWVRRDSPRRRWPPGRAKRARNFGQVFTLYWGASASEFHYNASVPSSPPAHAGRVQKPAVPGSRLIGGRPFPLAVSPPQATGCAGA